MTVSQDVAVPHQTFEITSTILVVTIAALLISIYPDFKHGINRGKQRRMMADIRAIARAVESYHDHFKVYPAGKTTVEKIRKELEAYLEEELPVKDEWGNQYIYRSDGLASYTIMSFGKDREQDGPIIYQGIIFTFENDMVFSNGSFITFPDGCFF